MKRKQEKSHTWLRSFFFGSSEECPSSRTVPLLSKQPLVLSNVSNNKKGRTSSKTLLKPNERLKKTIQALESKIAYMEGQHTNEITVRQEVIEKLQKHNLALYEQVQIISNLKHDYENMKETITAYEELIYKLQQENIELHCKVNVLLQKDNLVIFQGDSGYASSSLEDSPSIPQDRNIIHE
jgi:signal recognition particle GTPase